MMSSGKRCGFSGSSRCFTHTRRRSLVLAMTSDFWASLIWATPTTKQATIAATSCLARARLRHD
eukprot:8974631-Alexandrium_andersonii.AAC.1